MKDLLSDEDLRPTHTPFGVDAERQAETLLRLRELEKLRRQARLDRDDFVVANALSNSVSRPDMARAIGISRSRVDQIISSHYGLLQQRRNVAGTDLVARHMPRQAL